MRKLFADAEEEWKRCGSNSALHMIIFDEIDAICKQRGSMVKFSIYLSLLLTFRLDLRLSMTPLLTNFFRKWMVLNS